MRRESRDESFDAGLGELAKAAFSDPSIRTNPRIPLLREIVSLLQAAYAGPPDRTARPTAAADRQRRATECGLAAGAARPPERTGRPLVGGRPVALVLVDGTVRAAQPEQAEEFVNASVLPSAYVKYDLTVNACALHLPEVTNAVLPEPSAGMFSFREVSTRLIPELESGTGIDSFEPDTVSRITIGGAISGCVTTCRMTVLLLRT